MIQRSRQRFRSRGFRSCLLTPSALALLAVACNRSPGAGGETSANFELRCAPSNTASSAQLYCVRSDTRTGDILRVNIDKLPVTNGPTAAAPGRPGRYQTVCDATSTDTRSDFYCLRLDVENGDLMLINLLKVGTLPKDAK